MSTDTNSLHRSVANATNLEGTEEELVAEDSPTGCLRGRSFEDCARICLFLLMLL
jgi:hypothetical protein